jgi:hypothetical protein
MNDPIQTPEQAVEEFVGEQFIDWLMEYVGHEIMSWPETAALHSVQPRVEKLKKFLLQRFLASQALWDSKTGDPGFLSFAQANLSESDDPQAETALEILEQQGTKALLDNLPREQWVKLLKALGALDEEIEKVEPKEPARNFAAELSDVYSNSDWPVAMGALVAHQHADAVENEIIAALLKRQANVTDKDLEIFTIAAGHPAAAHVLDKIVFDPVNKQLVLDGARRQLAARQEFLKGILKYLQN